MPQQSAPPAGGVSPVLVGRHAEFTALTAAVSAPPALIVIQGEAGIGKSRLVRELLTAVSGTSAVLVGHCQQLHDPFPLGPVLDAFQHHGDLIEIEGLSPVVGSLAPLVPEIADRLPVQPERPADQREARHQIFRAATELLEHVSPAVLVLEDLHWADNVTFDFLTYLIAHQPAKLAVIVTSRIDLGTTPVGEAFARAPAGRTRSVRLAPLDVAEVGELSRHLLGIDVPDPIATGLYDVTGGVPFVVEEVLRTLLARLPAAEIPSHPDALAALSVSTALRDVVVQRLTTLDATAREVIDAAAVIDLAIDPVLLVEITEYDARQVATALTAAHAAGLLHDHEGRIRFRHVLAQQIVYEATPLPTRQWWHARVALVLEERNDPMLSARIAHHYQRAGRVREFVQWAEAAADEAVRHGNEAAAAEFLREATADMAALSLDDRVRIATKLGRVSVDGLAHAEAAPILTRLLDSQQLTQAARGELRFALGRLYRQQGFARDGYGEIERAVDDLYERPDLQARALAVLAAPETVVDVPLEVHLARSVQAEQAARRAGSPDVELGVRIARASLLLEQGDPYAWQLIDSARHDSVLLTQPREHARAAINWAQGALHIGYVSRADELLSEGRSIAERSGSPRLLEVYELVGAMVDHAAGRWDGLAERAHDLASRVFGFGAASFEAEYLNCLMLGSLGSTVEAAERLTELIRECERVGAAWPLIPARAALARLRLILGDARGGFDESTAALEQIQRKGMWTWAADALISLVDAASALGRTDDVRPRVTAIGVHVRQVEAPAISVAVTMCEALIAQVDGDGEAAEQLMSRARSMAQAAGLVQPAAQTTERLGDWRCARGAADGPSLLVEALTAYGRLSARQDIARVTRTMRRHGVPVPYPWRGGRPAHGNDLSRREREVVGRAAAGRTNREIAAEMFLSQRTVESHMSNALRKLGLRSRDELDAGLLEADPHG
ncbi:LuxR family transcriptional regulator [Microbacterium sp. B35-04]|uniref:helix-turn-helix transcriptional regulator n=1 Tax=Microbacterium sp. B35-04 TaxID=1961716 RepID=UPI0013D3A978|nr:LuxR family transcriptional regulator [Microbacterium sp. B35-04]